MSIQSEIEEAQRRLDSLKQQQKNCKHEWGATKSDPEPYTDYEIISGDFSQCRGSDFYPSTRPVTKYKDRWSRTCNKCGHTEYTYKQVVVSVVKEAKF